MATKKDYNPGYQSIAEIPIKRLLELKTELRLEIKKRRSVYSSMVYRGQMTKEEMNEKIERMKETGFILRLIHEGLLEMKHGKQLDFFTKPK